LVGPGPPSSHPKPVWDGAAGHRVRCPGWSIAQRTTYVEICQCWAATTRTRWFPGEKAITQVARAVANQPVGVEPYGAARGPGPPSRRTETGAGATGVEFPPLRLSPCRLTRAVLPANDPDPGGGFPFIGDSAGLPAPGAPRPSGAFRVRRWWLRPPQSPENPAAPVVCQPRWSCSPAVIAAR